MGSNDNPDSLLQPNGILFADGEARLSTIAMVQFDSAVRLAILRPGLIDYDWSQAPDSRYIAHIRQNVMEIINELIRIEGITCCSKLLLERDESGGYARTINFQLRHSGDFSLDSPRVKDVYTAVHHYAKYIFMEDSVTEERAGAGDADEASPSKLLANNLARVTKKMFGGKPAPSNINFQIGSELVPCNGYIHTLKNDAGDLPETITIQGHAAEMFGEDKHQIKIKHFKKRKSTVVIYDRENQECGWRLLRSGLDENTLFDVSMKPIVIDGEQFFKLISANEASRLFPD